MDDVISFFDELTLKEVCINIQADVNSIKKRYEEAKDFVLQCKDRSYNKEGK